MALEYSNSRGLVVFEVLVKFFCILTKLGDNGLLFVVYATTLSCRHVAHPSLTFDLQIILSER